MDRCIVFGIPWRRIISWKLFCPVLVGNITPKRGSVGKNLGRIIRINASYFFSNACFFFIFPSLFPYYEANDASEKRFLFLGEV